MNFAFTQDVPIDAAFYQRIVDGLGDATPNGLIVHLAVERDGGLRYIDVWENEQAWRSFVDDRLHPVLHDLLHDVFGDDMPPEPPQTELTVVHAWIGGAPT